MGWCYLIEKKLQDKSVSIEHNYFYINKINPKKMNKRGLG